ncbi:MAG: hypothetical protein VX642_01590 [Bdellovibrionota bacterium]|nr:hypothetical protein [Bdellovibrionota bacterium]
MKTFISILFLFNFVACGSSNCRKQPDPNFFAKKTENLPSFKEKTASKTGLGTGSTDWIQVFKPDGSLQCGMGAAISPEEMGKELRDKGIRIKRESKQNDSLMRIQVCGSPTGMINVYEIQSSNLEMVKKLGYKELKSIKK